MGLKKNTLLIYPSQFFSFNWGQYLAIKPQLLSLFSYLKNKQYNLNILDLELEIGRPKNKEEIVCFKKESFNLISKYNFDIVGISCLTSLNFLSSKYIAKICKQINKKCIIAVGGYHPTAVPGDFVYEGSPFDFIVRGEGELILEKICSKKIVKPSDHPFVISGLPLPLSDDFYIDFKAYPYIDYLKNERGLDFPLNISRGCPFSCIYCMESDKKYKKWRSFSAKKTLQEIQNIRSVLEPKQISFVEPCFGVSKKWRRNLLSSLIEKKIDNIFWADTRVDLMEREDIDLFSKLNFYLEFGIESFSSEMLTIMNKTRNPNLYLDKCASILKQASDRKLLIQLDFMFNHPGETKETIKDTLDFLKTLINEIKSPSFIIRGQNYAYFPTQTIHNKLDFFEKEYGTNIKNKMWWKYEEDFGKNAKDVIPSSDLSKNKNMWIDEFEQLGRKLYSNLPSDIKLFLWAQAHDFKTDEFLTPIELVKEFDLKKKKK